MTDKMQKQTVQKLFDTMKINPSLTPSRAYPSPYDPFYPQLHPSQPNPYALSDDPAYSLDSDKPKMPYPYSDYYKNPMYYPNFGMPKSNYPGQPVQNPLYPNNPLRPSTSASPLDNSQSSAMYQMGMQHGSPYPYGYPYYSYPGMPYPYSMYPPYYYNRSLSDMYSQSASPSGAYMGSPGQMGPPSHYLNSMPLPYNKHMSSVVKQEIVISSDEERGRHGGNRNKMGYKMMEKQGHDLTKGFTQNPEYLDAMTKRNINQNNVHKETKLEGHGAEIENKKQNNTVTDPMTPFLIKRKRIIKQDKQSKAQKKHRQKELVKQQKLARKKKLLQAKEALNSYGQKQYRQKDQVKQQLGLQKQKLSVVSSKFDSKQNYSSQKVQLKKLTNKSIQPSPALLDKQDKRVILSAEEKQNQKKEKVKDDHPLKQLRYSESHGRIRIGNYFQSAIPDVLRGDNMLMLRKQLQNRLRQREISAITF